MVTIDMEPPSQVISQVAGVGSDDPLSRLYTDIYYKVTGAEKASAVSSFK